MKFAREWLRFGLARRAMALVTLTLLPLGAIAIWQTDKILQEQRAANARALMGVTEDAAARERQVIERAIGAAAAMGNTAQSLIDSPADCAQVLRQFERGSALYTLAGFYPSGGGAPCLSGPTRETGTDQRFSVLVERKEMGLYTKHLTNADSPPYLVIATPAFEDDVYVGHLRLLISFDNFEPAADGMRDDRPLGLVTFNNFGEILTSERDMAFARDLLPANADLAELRSEKPYTFYSETGSGERRAFALVPLVPGVAYAIGTWETDADVLSLSRSYWITIILAVLMWLASVGVIYLIMQVLVIRGIQRLGDQIARFRTARSLPQGKVLGRGELYDLEEGFRDLAETIVRDEADLENAVHEKNVLLKEVHHRVKNNLQLINSIINMILRASPSDETRRVVSRLQDRVMALASVHRSIYQAQTMDRVDASEIVREIVNQSIKVGLPRDSAVQVDLDLATVTLYPDQVMPLSMLVSEAITNALKYVGGDAPRITVRLSETVQPEDGRRVAMLSVTNTVACTIDDTAGTGLGQQLVRAFAHQLEGRLHAENTGSVYRLEVSFEVADFTPEPQELPSAAE